DAIALDQLLRHEDTRGIVDSELARLLDLAPGCRPQLRLHLAAETAEGSRGHDRLARPADPDGEVVIRAADRRGDRGSDSPVLDQLDAGARGADVLDQVVVAWPVEHDRGDVVRAPAQRVGDCLDVL